MIASNAKPPRSATQPNQRVRGASHRRDISNPSHCNLPIHQLSLPCSAPHEHPYTRHSNSTPLLEPLSSPHSFIILKTCSFIPSTIYLCAFLPRIDHLQLLHKGKSNFTRASHPLDTRPKTTTTYAKQTPYKDLRLHLLQVLRSLNFIHIKDLTRTHADQIQWHTKQNVPTPAPEQPRNPP